MYFDISIGCKKIYFIFAPKKHIFFLQGLRENSDLITSFLQILKSLETTGFRNEIPFVLWHHVACHSDSWWSLNVVIKQSRGNYASVLQTQRLQ